MSFLDEIRASSGRYRIKKAASRRGLLFRSNLVVVTTAASGRRPRRRVVGNNLHDFLAYNSFEVDDEVVEKFDLYNGLSYFDEDYCVYQPAALPAGLDAGFR